MNTTNVTGPNAENTESHPEVRQMDPATSRVNALRADTKHELGYGLHLTNPEAFIRAVIGRYFSPIPRAKVDWENLVHEARVALFEQDLRLGGTIPETTSGYWWRAAQAIGTILYEDYGINNMFVRRRRPLSLYNAPPESQETAAIYTEKQRTEPDPATEAESREWFDHYMALAKNILLKNESLQQGERDCAIFELWVNGFSPKEIAERPEITWLRNRHSVDEALRRIIHRLWEFFGVNPQNHAMTLGDYTSNSDRVETSHGSDPKKRFQSWYADPDNRKHHQTKCRDRMRQKRSTDHPKTSSTS